MIRRIIYNAYEGATFTDIQTASDGILALTVFKQQLPDVVTLDITMPHMDGLAALSKMIEIKPNIVVLVVSALADHHTAIESLSRGAREFICKPFTSDDLQEALNSLLIDMEKRHEEAQPSRSMEHSAITHRVATAASESHHDSRPLEKYSRVDYISGYVEPPKVRRAVPLRKETDPIKRQVSFQDTRNQLMESSSNRTV